MLIRKKNAHSYYITLINAFFTSKIIYAIRNKKFDAIFISREQRLFQFQLKRIIEVANRICRQRKLISKLLLKSIFILKSFDSFRYLNSDTFALKYSTETIMSHERWHTRKQSHWIYESNHQMALESPIQCSDQIWDSISLTLLIHASMFEFLFCLLHEDIFYFHVLHFHNFIIKFCTEML